MQPVNDFQDVAREVSRRAVRAILADRVRDVRDPDAPAVPRVAVRGGNAAPVLVVVTHHKDFPPETVRVRDAQRALRTADLQARMTRPPDIEACHDRADRPRSEIENAGDVRRDLDGDHLPAFRFAGDHSLRKGDASRTRDAFHRPDHVHQGRQVVRTHVEHGTGASLVEEGGIRMPALVSMTHHERGGRHRRSDPSVVDQFPAGLVRPPHERVRGRSHANAFFPRFRHEPFRVVQLDGNRFLRVGVLALLHRRHAEVEMRSGDRQVENEVNVRIRNDLVRRTVGLRQAVLFGCSLRPFGNDVRASQHLHAVSELLREVVEIRAANVAHTNNADSNSFHGCSFPDLDFAHTALNRPSLSSPDGSPKSRPSVAKNRHSLAAAVGGRHCGDTWLPILTIVCLPSAVRTLSRCSTRLETWTRRREPRIRKQEGKERNERRSEKAV